MRMRRTHGRRHRGDRRPLHCPRRRHHRRRHGRPPRGQGRERNTDTPTCSSTHVGDYRPAKSFFAKSPPDQWRRLHELNLWHVFAVTHALLPGMIAAGGGSIVNVSTVEAFRGIPRQRRVLGVQRRRSPLSRRASPSNSGPPPSGSTPSPPTSPTPRRPRPSSCWPAATPRCCDPGFPPDASGHPRTSRSGGLPRLARRCVHHGSHDPVDGGTLAAAGWYGKASGRGWTNMPDQA